MTRPAPAPADALARLASTLLGPAPDPLGTDSAAAFVGTWRTEAARGDAPLAAAIAAARRADRLAWAFLSAYQAAIRETFDAGASMPDVGSFVANESGRRIVEIETRLERGADGGTLVGAKSWCLRAVEPFALYVLARDAAGPASGPGSLVVVRVRSDAPGVRFSPGGEQPVVPELPHARVAFDAVRVPPSDVLPGDGYGRYARPFRLAEDLCMAATGLAWLTAEAARHGWPGAWRQRAAAAVAALATVFAHRTDDPAFELLAAGTLSLAADVTAEADGHWTASGPSGDAHERWLRDRPLLAGGREARRERARSAWRRLGGEGARAEREGTAD